MTATVTSTAPGAALAKAARQLRDRARTTQFGRAVENLAGDTRKRITSSPSGKAVRIVKDYVFDLYYPVHRVSLARRLRTTPLLLATEYLVYRVDAVAERNVEVDLNAEQVRDYRRLRTYKRVLRGALRFVGAWNAEVARQIEEGERFVRHENALTTGTRPRTHEAIMTTAELRPTDVRMLHAMMFAIDGKEMDEAVRDLLHPVEVLADIANDLRHYERDVTAGTFNVYAALVDLHGPDAPRVLKEEVDRYEAVFEQRLAAYSSPRTAEIARLCRRRYAAARAAFPDPIDPATLPVPPKKKTAAPISTSVFVTGSLCAIAWIVAYAGIIWRGFADDTFGMPVTALAANLSWEFVYGFVIDPFGDYIHNFSIVWFLVDLVIAWQAWKHGRRDFASPFVRKNFRTLFTSAVGIALPITYLAFVEFRDPDGEYTGFGVNLLMSILFVAMLDRRDSVAGQSMYIAVSKWLGTLLAWVATALTVTTSPKQPLPTSWRAFLSGSFGHRDYPLTPLINVIYWVTFVVDAVYTVQLGRRLRAAGTSPWRRF